MSPDDVRATMLAIVEAIVQRRLHVEAVAQVSSVVRPVMGLRHSRRP
jgi:hypothetical protein